MPTTVAMIVGGAVPLAVFFAFEIPLRLVQRWEIARTQPGDQA
jgi:hypothetical protein